jgi:sirohydrochlorin ferrochelatase
MHRFHNMTGKWPRAACGRAGTGKTMAEAPTTAILLIAHGSRHEEANGDTRFLAERFEKSKPYPIAVAAFLELAQPDIDAGAELCVERGAERVIMLPHFLSAGTHVQRDLLAARTRLAARFPHVEFRLAQPMGRHPLLEDVLADRAREVS